MRFEVGLGISLSGSALVAGSPWLLLASHARQAVRDHVPGQLAFDTHMPLWKRCLGLVQTTYLDPELTNIRIAREQA